MGHVCWEQGCYLLVCLCVGFAALEVASSDTWLKSMTPCCLECFLVWIGNIVLLVRETAGVVQSVRSPGSVGAACRQLGRCWLPHRSAPAPHCVWLKWAASLGFWDHGVNMYLPKRLFIFMLLLICLPLEGCAHWDFHCSDWQSPICKASKHVRKEVCFCLGKICPWRLPAGYSLVPFCLLVCPYK